MNYLNREAACFSPEIWSAIDATATRAASEMVTGRSFLPLEGPFGLGLTSVEVGSDGYCRQPQPNEAGAVVSRAISVPMIRRAFQLSIRRIEGFLTHGQPLDLRAVQEAAEAVARREEEFVYYGNPDFGLNGLLTTEGSHHTQGRDWSDTQRALEDVLAAVNLVDEAGFRGPYALALSPPLYNSLFRRYEGTDMLQLEHLRRLCEAGVYKAPIDRGLLVDPRVGRLVLGQDLMAGYARQDGIHHELYLSESLVLMVEAPRALCVIDFA